MARPEPNICSQKWGKGWAGAEASTRMSCGFGEPPPVWAGGHASIDATEKTTSRKNRVVVPIRTILRRPEMPRQSLEAKASLEFHRTACQSLGCRAEKRIGCRGRGTTVADDSRLASKSKWREIELVKNVIGGYAQLDSCAGSKGFHLGQSELLRDGQIDVLISGAAETVASDSRELRSDARSLEGEVGVRSTDGKAGESWEIPGRWRQKCRRVVFVSGAAVVTDRPNHIETAARSQHRANILSDWGPRESGVKLKDSVELPAD